MAKRAMSLLSLAGLTAVAAALAGCGSSSHGATRASFQNPQLSFSYPAAWKRHDCSVQRGESPATIAVLTNLKSQSGDVCRTEYWSTRLGANGVIIAWELHDFVGPVHIARFSGKPTHMGNRDARLTVRSLEPAFYGCGHAGGQKDLLVTTAGTAPHTTLTVEACLRGPALARGEAAFRKMLASVSFAG